MTGEAWVSPEHAGALPSQLSDRPSVKLTMKKVGAFEAKNILTMLLDAVEHGEEVVITRHGKAVARLVPDRPRH